jgi:hypothetical protein
MNVFNSDSELDVPNQDVQCILPENVFKHLVNDAVSLLLFKKLLKV